ncbi:MAG TPA: signal peptidase I [Pseudonocardiaceae bacterium]|jgi:signal peptidase I|nr:signal peptidase I [Pseudonocardiaceae bacterium]
MTASEDERERMRRSEPVTDWFNVPDWDDDEPKARAGDKDEYVPPDDTPTDPEGAPAQRRFKSKTDKKKGSFWKELPILIVIALVLTFLIQTFIARVYVIPSGSMEQTLNGCTGCNGDRILVDKLTFDFTDPQPGDVVVFKGPPGWDQSEFNVDETSNVVLKWLRQFGSSIGIGTPPEYDLVKRIVAVGGQTVQCCNAQNQLMVNGKALNEPYVYIEPGTESMAYYKFGPVTIPQGDIWVEGDNRGNSNDSRFQNHGGINGVVPVSDVIGVARTIIWPPSRWRGVGETNGQTLAMGLGTPGWTEGLPLGVGFAAAFPVLWLGKKSRRTLRSVRGERR